MKAEDWIKVENKLPEDATLVLVAWCNPDIVGMGYCFGDDNWRCDDKAIAKMVKQRLRAMGINGKKYSAHSLRHTFGSLLVEQNVEMEDIRELMGHSSTAVTKIYVELVQQRKMLHSCPSAKMIDQLCAL